MSGKPDCLKCLGYGHTLGIYEQSHSRTLIATPCDCAPQNDSCATKPCSACGQPRNRPGRYCKACHAGYMREWRKTHPLEGEAKMKDDARSRANTAQKRGKIAKQPCALCGAAHAEKHHPDYSKPLDVVWLCRPHHLALHQGKFGKVPKRGLPAKIKRAIQSPATTA